MARPQRIVVLGHGIAALTAAESLRDNGFDGELTLIGDEPHAPYSRPALSKAALLDDDLAALSLPASASRPDAADPRPVPGGTVDPLPTFRAAGLSVYDQISGRRLKRPQLHLLSLVRA